MRSLAAWLDVQWRRTAALPALIVLAIFLVGVTYDTNLTRAEQMIKQIGKELTEASAFSRPIRETLKMQSVASSAVSPSSGA